MARIFAILLFALCTGCGGPVVSNDAATDIRVPGVFAYLATPPELSCRSAHFSFTLSGVDSPPAADELRISIAEDWAMDGGAVEMPVPNNCPARTLDSAGVPTYSICLDGLSPSKNYFVRVSIGFDGSVAQPIFRLGTPACGMDAGTD